MGDTDNLTREMGEVRATLASDLGRLKADFAAMLQKVDQIKENYSQFQQVLSQLPEMHAKITSAIDTINKLSNSISVQENTTKNNKDALLSELGHLKESVLQKMETEILNLDRDIVARLPHDTIMHNIEDLYAKYNNVGGEISSKVSSAKSDLEKQITSVQTAQKTLDTDLQSTKTEVKVQNVKIGIGVAVAGIIVNLILTLGFKFLFDTTPKQVTSARAESTQHVKQLETLPSDTLK